MDSNRPVLICMDLHREFITPGRPWADPDGERVSKQCSKIMQHGRANAWTLIHIQLDRDAPFLFRAQLDQIITGCEPRADEVSLQRAGVSAYSHLDVFDILESLKHRDIYLIGFSAPTSITHTLFDAKANSHLIKIVESAIGSMDLEDWGAKYARLLCFDTAKRLGRFESLADLPLCLEDEDGVASPL